MIGTERATFCQSKVKIHCLCQSLKCYDEEVKLRSRRNVQTNSMNAKQKQREKKDRFESGLNPS